MRFPRLEAKDMKMKVTQQLMLTAVSVVSMTTTCWAYVTRIDQCEPIEIPRCRSMPYNMTQMPNLMHHNTQENARLLFEKFELLLDQGCSDMLLFLLCSVYVPICAVSLQAEAIPPCRSVCEKARAGCQPLMAAFQVPWPEYLDCAKLPSYERGVCVSPEAFVQPAAQSSSSSSSSSSSTDCTCKRRKPSYRIFKKYNYDYGIRALVMEKNVTTDEVIYKVKVTETLFIGKVKVPLHVVVMLWANSSCACPKLKTGRESLILGHEDSSGHKLMISPLSIGVQWRDSWAIKVGRWREQLRLQASRVKQRKPAKGRNSKGKGRQLQTDVKGTDTIPSGSTEPSIGESSRPNIGVLANGYTHGGRYYVKGFPQQRNVID